VHVPDEVWPTDAPCGDTQYADVFVAPLSRPTNRSAEECMRDALEGAPLLVRTFVSFGWRFVLGLKPVRSNAILGWPIASSSGDVIVLEQHSRLLDAALLLRRYDDHLTWATRVHYKSRAALPVWAVVRLLHRVIAPYSLRRSAAR
jgi:hypothetical protein